MRSPAAERSTRLGGNGAWSWFTDPRAIRYADTTLIGFVTREGDVDIGAFDHSNRSFLTHRLSKRLDRNDHASPALLRRGDGRILAFYSAHNGADLLYRMTERPDDITEWLPEGRIPDDGAGDFGFTYPNPVQVAAEPDRIFLFFRGRDWNPRLSISDDGGHTWGKATSLLRAPGRPYVKVFGDGSTIHIAYTDGHPHEEPGNRVLYLAYRGGGFHRADGTRIGSLDTLPLGPDHGDTVFEPTPSAPGPGWIWDVAADNAGRPVIAFATIVDSRTHAYHYARFHGGRWQTREVAGGGGSTQVEEEGAYSAGLTIDKGNPGRLFVARWADRSWRLESIVTPDGGDTWERHTLAESEGDEKFLRPAAVRGHNGDDVVVLWMRGRYDHYRDYDTQLWAWRGEATNAPM